MVVLLVGITMLTSGASAGVIFFYGNNLPSLKDFKHRFQFENTLIRDWQGRVLYDMANISKNQGRRVVEPLMQPGNTSQHYKSQNEDWLVGNSIGDHGIPVVLQDATIATEDASFYNNPGFDPLSIARAGYENWTQGHIVSGASTITQQLVKEYMLTPNPSLSRKIEEIILSAELTQKYPKSKILWYYLNSVPYGNLTNGAEAASKQYFGKDVWQLDLAQSAFLAGLPEAPSTYDPVNNLSAALNRMHYVLSLMCEHGYLARDSDGTCATAIHGATQETKNKAKFPKFSPPVTTRLYPHFVQYAISQLQQLSQEVPALHGRVYGGLDVRTTLDERLQNAAQNIVTNQVNGLAGLNVTNGALVSLDLRPQYYGFVRSMVGSADYNNVAISGKYNMANTPRQPGSSFKPFNYVYAFQNGLGPGTSVLDAPVAIPDTGNPADGGWYVPTNYDHAFHGAVTLRVALANSLNVPAVKVEQYGASQGTAGVMNIANQAVKMGIKSLLTDNPHCCGWSLTLGGLEHGVRLVEETSAFGAFATEGTTVPPIAIAEVRDRSSGKLLYSAPRDVPDQFKGHQVSKGFAPYAYLINNILSDNSSRCVPVVCEFGLNSPLNLGRTAAAKTGTTNSFTDNWTVGYTPDIVTGVWVGNTNNNPMAPGTSGITGAAPIWHDYMLTAFRILHLPPKEFVQPPGVLGGTECLLNTTYTAYSSMGYDLVAGRVPDCAVGTNSINIPNAATNYQSPAAPYQPAAPPVRQPIAAPTRSVAPAVPQQRLPAVQPTTRSPAAQPPANTLPPGTRPTH